MNDVPVARQNRADRAPSRRERRLPYAPPEKPLSSDKGFFFSVKSIPDGIGEMMLRVVKLLMQ